MKSVAVVGASGAVGREMLRALEGMVGRFAVRAYASANSAGLKLPFAGDFLTVDAYSREVVGAADYVLMSAGSAFSRQEAPALAEQVGAVIDNSSAWRMQEGVPLIVAGVNDSRLQDFSSGIIANPNCSTIQMCVSLAPLRRAFGIKMVNVCTYQSVSGSGQKGLNELERQRHEFLGGAPARADFYPAPIINNIIPAIDGLDDDGHCFEEIKMVDETRKIFDLSDLTVFASTARVPVSHCHSEALTVELRQAATRNEVFSAMKAQTGLRLIQEDSYSAYAYPDKVVGSQDVWVCRVRLPVGQTASQMIQYWNVADNLTVGAATNAVRILESLAK